LTMFIATPYLDEAERCARVALLDRGRVLALDEPARLQAAMQGVVIEIVASPPRQALEIARRGLTPSAVQLFGDRLHVQVDQVRDADGLAGELTREGISVTSVRPILPTLEDVFIERLAAAQEERR
jgi:ABC-2 type transport system ATP-binding protein